MKMIKVFLSVILFSGIAFAQQMSKIDNHVPSEVQKLIDDGSYGMGSSFEPAGTFAGHKNIYDFGNATKLSDIRTGNPIKVYRFPYDTASLHHHPLLYAFLKQDENTPVSELIVPGPQYLNGQWCIPLMVNGKIVVFGWIGRKTTLDTNGEGSLRAQGFNPEEDRKWHWTGLGGGPPNWQKVIEKWPKSKGYNPVLIDKDPDLLLYVPEKDDYNLTYLGHWSRAGARGYQKDPLTIVPDSTYSILTSSKEVLKYLKAPPVGRGTKTRREMITKIDSSDNGMNIHFEIPDENAILKLAGMVPGTDSLPMSIEIIDPQHGYASMRTLIREIKTPGHYVVFWDGRGNNNQTVPCGTYLCELIAATFMDSKRIALCLPDRQKENAK